MKWNWLKKDYIPDYEGFMEHIREWDELGICYGHKELEILAEMYHTPKG